MTRGSPSGVAYSQRWYDTFLRSVPEDVTAEETEWLAAVLPPPPARVLDVACGLGRHMHALAARGYECVGVELEPAIAAEARAAGLDVRTLDMRELEHVEGDVDGVISMWASFGWFDDETNAHVLRSMARKLRPGGVLVLDVWTPSFFEAHQGTREIRPGMLETRRVRDGRLEVEYDSGERFAWVLYEPAELAARVPDLTLATVDSSPERPRTRLVFHASAASSGASAAAPSTSDATVR
jgi:SAM-dependent methyltransferase